MRPRDNGDARVRRERGTIPLVGGALVSVLHDYQKRLTRDLLVPLDFR
jgi:hypothetical protein